MRLLVIEDDDRVAHLIGRGFEEEGWRVDLAFDGQMGKRLALTPDHDAIIMDLILPKLNGLDLCREIRQARPDVPILMLTALGTTDDKVEGFDAGADDYLVKPFEFRELSVRLRTLLKRQARQPVGSPVTLRLADLELNVVTHTVTRAGQEIPLTPKEFKLLEYMLLHQERLLTRAEIAEKVWDTHFDTGTNFIDVYINYLRKKIDRDYEPKLIHTKSGVGFVLKIG
ncbi:response regulator transcription factor [Siphonobacter sp. SORGH_AS_0500]|uniref:response regulator transcription factor n=1 Tax=Siphonobacter sp. SORGH_AS_0500 TaxID=1864824 RepID=UPI002861C6EB|nr:response regulator transcription factor [Siphonobacter sp. SORGH_AS_0500]MDR6197504.1 DNA-binding response OmpR family regulator [Siphonobacter sp. SORGH_AS_0500]